MAIEIFEIQNILKKYQKKFEKLQNIVFSSFFFFLKLCLHDVVGEKCELFSNFSRQSEHCSVNLWGKLPLKFLEHPYFSLHFYGTIQT